jgi:uncharacterized protein YdhG (YjbR/CyaY superfamily)
MSPADPCKLTRMRSPRRANRQAASKGRMAPKSVEDYLAGVPEPARSTLKKMRVAIRSVVPAEATEIISYQMPAFKLRRVLVWFAAFSNHCSLFPTAAVLEAFEGELKGFTTSKGTVQFPVGRPLPTALIKRLVRARVALSRVGARP